MFQRSRKLLKLDKAYYAYILIFDFEYEIKSTLTSSLMQLMRKYYYYYCSQSHLRFFKRFHMNRVDVTSSLYYYLFLA